jgi:hypothetical protein
MSTYRGRRDGATWRVTVDGRPLDPRRDLLDNGAPEFEWARVGGGASQLALAILAHHAGDDVALRAYVPFASSVVAGLPTQKWTLFGADVDTALAVIESHPPRAKTRSNTRPSLRPPSQPQSARRPTRSS